MYTRWRVRTYQANPDHTCYICYVTLPAPKKSAELAIHCTASLHNDGCCEWLWTFNSNVSVMFIEMHSVLQYF